MRTCVSCRLRVGVSRVVGRGSAGSGFGPSLGGGRKQSGGQLCPRRTPRGTWRHRRPWRRCWAALASGEQEGKPQGDGCVPFSRVAYTRALVTTPSVEESQGCVLRPPTCTHL